MSAKQSRLNINGEKRSLHRVNGHFMCDAHPSRVALKRIPSTSYAPCVNAALTTQLIIQRLLNHFIDQQHAP